MSKKCEFQLKLSFFAVAMWSGFVFCVVPLVPNKLYVCMQPVPGKDIDTRPLLLLPQCLFSQNL